MNQSQMKQNILEQNMTSERDAKCVTPLSACHAKSSHFVLTRWCPKWLIWGARAHGGFIKKQLLAGSTASFSSSLFVGADKHPF